MCRPHHEAKSGKRGQAVECFALLNSCLLQGNFGTLNQSAHRYPSPGLWPLSPPAASLPSSALPGLCTGQFSPHHSGCSLTVTSVQWPWLANPPKQKSSFIHLLIVGNKQIREVTVHFDKEEEGYANDALRKPKRHRREGRVQVRDACGRTGCQQWGPRQVGAYFEVEIRHWHGLYAYTQSPKYTTHAYKRL